MRIRGLVSFGVLLGLVAACAKIERPPGGPEDREPPELSEVAPEPNATGVAVDSAVVLTFSEKLDKRSVMRALVTIPRVDYESTQWEESTLRLVPAGGWPEDRNVILSLGVGAKDRRGNTLREPVQWVFTTKDVADSGSARGKLHRGREVGRYDVYVSAHEGAPPDSGEEWSEPVAIERVPASGGFELRRLDAASALTLVGYADVDGDLRPGGRRDVTGTPYSLGFDSTGVARVAEFLVGTLDSIGTVSGLVEADSGLTVVVFAQDASGGVAAREVVADDGKFALKLATGVAYELAAFVDANSDTTWSEEEEIVRLESGVSLEFVSKRENVKFELAAVDSVAAKEAESGEASREVAPSDTTSGGSP